MFVRSLKFIIVFDYVSHVYVYVYVQYMYYGIQHYYYHYYYSLEFFTQRHLMVFHWSLSDSKCPQVSRTLLSILAVFSNAVVWMVSTRPSTTKSSSPFNNPLVTVPKASITIDIIVTFMFHSFFNSLARSKYLSLFSHSFSFILGSARTAKSTTLLIFIFLLIIIRSDLLAEIRWSFCISCYYYYYYIYPTPPPGQDVTQCQFLSGV